jgi:hypothetical protein
MQDNISFLLLDDTHRLSSARISRGKIRSPNGVTYAIDTWPSPVKITLFVPYYTLFPKASAMGWVSEHVSFNDRITEAEEVAHWFETFELR